MSRGQSVLQAGPLHLLLPLFPPDWFSHWSVVLFGVNQRLFCCPSGGVKRQVWLLLARLPQVNREADAFNPATSQFASPPSLKRRQMILLCPRDSVERQKNSPARKIPGNRKMFSHLFPISVLVESERLRCFGVFSLDSLFSQRSMTFCYNLC